MYKKIAQMKWVTLLSVVLLTACAEEKASSVRDEIFVPATKFEQWKADTAMYFYQSLSLYNYQHAAKYVTEPDLILSMEEGEGRLTVKEKSFRVKTVTDEGAVLLFSRYCYPDREVMVYMDHTPLGFRIDFRRTMKEQISSVPDDYAPLRQYCYEFKDQPLQGIVFSKAWQPVRVATQESNYSSGPRTQIAILDERCESFPECTYIGDHNHAGNVFYVSALDFSDSGGNLGGEQYIRLFQYPDYNLIFREGSYRVTHLGNDKVRLELSLPEFESTELNGAIEFEMP